MDQSSGSSVQTQIFPPENIKNIRLCTKYTERNIVKMMLNCFVLDTGVHFSIPLGEKVSVGEYEYSIESLSISILKDYIWECRNNVLKDLTNDVSKLDLWHVNVEEVVNVSNEDDIIQKLRGDKMKPNLPLSNYFSVSDPPPKWNIHIIIHRPPTTDQRLTDISRVIGELGYFPRQNGRGGTMLFKLEQDAYTVEGISLTDPDINKRPELVSFLVKRLEQRRVILFRAPPYSGKTSLAQLLENYLVVNNSSEKLRVIRVSLLWGSSVGVKCEYDTFCEVWKKIVGVEWYEWAGQCEKIPTVLIMDETQRIYESMEEADESTEEADESMEEADESMEEADKSTEEADESMENTGTADEFWDTIKACLQGTNLSVIMFAAYGYGAKSAGLSTPLHIQPENCMSLRDIRFTDKKLEEYIGDYCVRNFGLSIYDYIVLQFIRYINHATAGHVGFVRHILERTKDEMQSKIRNEKLNWKEIYRYLNSSRFNQTINSCRAAPKLYKFSKAQKKICEDVYLNGSVLFSDNDDNHKDLIKTGILIVDNTNCLCFSAPLIERSFFQQHYGSETRASSTPGSLYEFIVKTFTIICNESDKVLKDSLGTGKNKRLFEQTWQKEFYKAGTRALGSHHFLSCDVGPHFKSKGYIDFYVDELEWAIELLREGLGMEEHNRRFETTGEYKEIVEVAKEKAIIDVRSKTKKVLELKEEFVHVSYSDNYDSFMIECLGKETIEIIKS